MTDNPFQSPQCTDLVDLSSAELDLLDRRGYGAWTTGPVGLVLGGVLVAVAGALGSALLGLSRALSEPQIPDDIDKMFLGMGMIGAVFGVVGGAFWGVIAGVAMGISRLRSRKKHIWLSTILIGLYGASVGGLGGAAISIFRPDSDLWVAIGAAIGAITGSCAGWLFAWLTARFCWAHLRKPVPVNGPGIAIGLDT